MPVVMVTNLYNNLGARCRYQRHEEHKGEECKR